METLIRDVRDATRQWSRTPGVTLVVVLSLALGIGANTAIFSLTDALLLRPLPVSQPGQLVRILNPRYNNHSYPTWRAVQQHTAVLAGTAAVSLMRPDISPTRERRSAQGLAVSGEFFPLLGVQPALGRLITPDDDRAGAVTNVAVLEYEFWQRAYGGRDVVGQQIPLDGQPFTIIGVTQRGFFGLNVGRRFDLAIPLEGFRIAQPGMASANGSSLTIVGRLKPGQSDVQAQAEFRSLQSVIRAAVGVATPPPQMMQPWEVTALNMGMSTAAQDRYRAPLRLLMAIAGLVLVIACANVANLLLARGAARQSELAVRLALGASRASVLRALALESLLVAIAGAFGGLLAGSWTARAIVSAITVNQSSSLATWIDVPLDGRMLAFTATAGAVTAILFGVGPAWWATRVQPLDAIRRRGRGVVTASSKFGAAHWLVAAQVAVSFVLLLGGALLVRSFVAMTTQDLGFDAEDLTIVTPDYSRSTVTREQRAIATDRIREDLAAQPGIIAAGFSETTPHSIGSGTIPIELPGHAAPAGQELTALLNRVDTSYFNAVGMTLLAGRHFGPFGSEPASTVIVNEAFVDRYFSDGAAVGRTFGVRMRDRSSVEVVGVVGNALSRSLREPVEPEVFLPFATAADVGWLEITVRTALAEPAARAVILAAIERQAPGASAELRTMASGLRDAAARERVVAWLAGGFALLALLLSAIGLYGVMAYHVERRRHEFGVRMAVGAAPTAVLRLVLAQTAMVLAVGLLGGLAASLAAGRVIAALLYGVSPADPGMTAVAAVVLSGVALGAGYLPARKAAQIDPMAAVRED